MAPVTAFLILFGTLGVIALLALGFSFILSRVFAKLNWILRSVIAALGAGFIPMISMFMVNEGPSDSFTYFVVLALIGAIVAGFPAACFFTRWLEKRCKPTIDPDAFR